MKNKPYTKNTVEVRKSLQSIGFRPLSFYQGKKYLTISISDCANKNKAWKELEYITFDDPWEEYNISAEEYDLIKFIKKVNAILNKRKPGQPKKPDAKQRYATRLHPDIIKIIKQQTNQSAFIEHLVTTNLHTAKE